MTKPCPFCNATRESFYETDTIQVLWDGFPVSPGHALLITRRHVASWFDATEEERSSLMLSLDAVKTEIVEKFGEPDGWNIGINIGAAGGQTVPHLHMHLIPRRIGDVPDPRGGVRHVIPSKGNYLAGKS